MRSKYHIPIEHRYEGDILYIKCRICGKRDTTEGFIKDRCRTYGVVPECRICYKEKRHKNIEKCNDYSKRYYLEHRDEIRARIKRTRDTHTKELGFNWTTFHKKAKVYAVKHNLRPTKCPICGKEARIEMHHPSYENSKEWSNVVFCCKFCHKSIHQGLLECPKPINLLEYKSPLKDVV